MDRITEGFLSQWRFDWVFVSVASFLHYFEHGSCDLQCKVRWDGIANLNVLLCPVALEEIIVRKCLKSRSFADGQSAALVRIWMDKIMAILCDMARYGA